MLHMRPTATHGSKVLVLSLQLSANLLVDFVSDRCAGVGELSAINGVAGSFSEHVPVVHIVGCPSTSLQRAEALLHHTLGNGDFHVFRDMSGPISHAQIYLDDPASAPAEIDRALTDAYIHARPVYVMIPTDMVPKKVSGRWASHFY